MSDAQVLFLVLAALYLGECAWWLPRSSVALRQGWSQHWQRIHPGRWFGNHHGGLVFGFPWPPLGAFLVGTQPQLSWSPDGVLAFVAFAVHPEGRPPQTGRFVRWGDLKQLEVSGRRLRLNSNFFLRASSRWLAAQLAQDLRRFSNLSPAERSAAFDQAVRRSFDLKAFEQAWRAYCRITGPLRWLANLLWVFLFVVAPAATWYFGIERIWPGLLAGLFGLSIPTGLAFRRCHAVLYPEAAEERFNRFLTLMLSPPLAIRALDLLSRPLAERFHPLLLAWRLGEPAGFTPFARKVVLDLRHPARPWFSGGEVEIIATEQFARQLWLQATEDFLRQQSIDLVALTQPCAPQDATCRSYCPRCEAQFTRETALCLDCGGIPTEPLGRGILPLS